MKITIISYVCTILFISSCTIDNCYKSPGKISEKIINTNSFKTIEINDVFRVSIKQDSLFCVIVKAGDKIIDNVLCEVDDDILKIKDDNSCYWLKSFERPEITIVSPEYEHIILNGESDIISLGIISCNNFSLDVYAGASSAEIMLNCNKFEFSLNQGTGNFNFGGECINSFYYNLGTGFIYADNLSTNNSTVTNISSGDIYLNVTEKLDVELKSSGDIYYYGDPEVNILGQTSSGELIKL